MEQFSKDGRKLRPRKNAAESAGQHNKPSFGSDRPHRKFGDKPSFGSDRPRRNFSDKPSSDSGRPRRSFGDKPAFGEGRPRRNFGDKPSFGEGKPRRNFGDKPAFGEGKPRRNFGDKPSFGEGKPRRSFGDKPSFGEGKPRRSFGDKPAFGRKPFRKKDAEFSRESDEGINRMISRKPQLDENRYSDFDEAATPIKDEVRLNKFIANSGVCSRREADTLIQAGVVTVNGQVVTELGTKVNIHTDDIRFNGERLKGEEKVYLVMNKPKGYVTTASDPHAEKTVMELLKGCGARVFPVGRLDKNTTGVLMFTNDGEIAERLTHPSYDKKKIYQVILDREVSKEDYDSILSGISLTDGEVKADELEYIDDNDHRKMGIEIHSGKNRIVRRIFESLGYDVRALDRVYFAGLTKKGLKKGEWRFLTEGEVNILKMGAYI